MLAKHFGFAPFSALNARNPGIIALERTKLGFFGQIRSQTRHFTPIS
jgi:hypothetical protein